jgi:23S rRNA pseudouridine1911/1915/1917 synthase
VHLAAIGHGVLGDITYGVPSKYLTRQFLHSHRLGFRQPSTGEYLELESPLPPDLERALAQLS